jgi:glutaryl-CoA dehydrogenase
VPGWISDFRASIFLHLDSSFSQDELLVRRTARDFVEDNVIPIIEECFRAGRFPRELTPLMGKLGFLGASLDGYGCAGMSNVECDLVMQELERGDSGLRSFVSVQSALVMYPIYTFGSDEQRNVWLPSLASTSPGLRPTEAEPGSARCAQLRRLYLSPGNW